MSAIGTDERIILEPVPQGACPLCGPRVYTAQILDILETAMYRSRTAVSRD